MAVDDRIRNPTQSVGSVRVHDIAKRQIGLFLQRAGHILRVFASIHSRRVSGQLLHDCIHSANNRQSNQNGRIEAHCFVHFAHRTLYVQVFPLHLRRQTKHAFEFEYKFEI